eukprot:GHRQ01025558.1.p1 GENE.GHRQ01025558.1~~GHRQ01025558.1.p1  ORF type:complete len:248 (+),score=55.45 GHRQ01025558.1:731-1474(+)
MSVTRAAVSRKLSRGRMLRIKVISLGDTGTGKSCLIKRYCEEKFISKYIPTIGADYGVKPVHFAEHEVRVNLWDLAGPATYLEVRNEFYKDTQGALLVYDATSRPSFEALGGWLQEAQRFGAPHNMVRASREQALGCKRRKYRCLAGLQPGKRSERAAACCAVASRRCHQSMLSTAEGRRSCVPRCLVLHRDLLHQHPSAPVVACIALHPTVTCSCASLLSQRHNTNHFYTPQQCVYSKSTSQHSAS